MQTFLANFLPPHNCIIQLFTLGTPNLMLKQKHYLTIILLERAKYKMINNQQGE